jgi:hypothetical protein
MNKTSVVQKLRQRTDKWDCTKLKVSAWQRKQSLVWGNSLKIGRNILPAMHLTKAQETNPEKNQQLIE